MPSLETPDGRPVDVTPVADAEAVNARFAQALAGDPPAAEQELPRRAVRGPATDAARPRVAKAAKADKSRTTRAPAVALTPDKRHAGVKSLVQVAAVVPLALAKAEKDPARSDAFKADAVTIASAGDALADACVQVADADPKFAAALDKVCATGPYGALISVAFGVSAQLFRNHRPGTAIPGTVDPAELIKAQNEMERAA